MYLLHMLLELLTLLLEFIEQTCFAIACELLLLLKTNNAVTVLILEKQPVGYYLIHTVLYHHVNICLLGDRHCPTGHQHWKPQPYTGSKRESDLPGCHCQFNLTDNKQCNVLYISL